MASATVAHQTTPQQPSKAFYATLYDHSGILAKVDGQILFLAEADQTITAYEPEMAPWTCILGEVGIADPQQLIDRLRGGYARIACTRQ